MKVGLGSPVLTSSSTEYIVSSPQTKRMVINHGSSSLIYQVWVNFMTYGAQA